jgi:integrase
VETETGANRKFARKLAALWENDLNSGRDLGRHSTGWQQFRLRYESEVVPGLADGTAHKIATVLNAVEKALPRVAGGKLADLNPEALSRFQADLRDGKRSESTIGSYLAHLRSALAWAHDQGMTPTMLKIKRPQRAKKRGSGTKAKGRPITLEEFERLLGKVPAALGECRKRKRDASRKTRANKGQAIHRTATDSIPVEVAPATVASWRHYLRGLWLSGLRLQESLDLYWDRLDRLCIDLTGKRPRLSIPAECEKGNRDRLLPITPDFAEFLLRTPEAGRHGPVFRPLMPSGRASYDQAGRMLTLIGELARVVVHSSPTTGKVKYASAHSLRAGFGNRWAKRVMPAVLRKLMRHESIETTLAYYVNLDVDELAEDLYRAHDQGQGGRLGTVLGTADDSTADSAVSAGDSTPNGQTAY